MNNKRTRKKNNSNIFVEWLKSKQINKKRQSNYISNNSSLTCKLLHNNNNKRNDMHWKVSRGEQPNNQNH